MKFHVFGLANSILVSFLFFNIVKHGYFIAVEPIKPLLYFEFLISILICINYFRIVFRGE